MPVMKTLLTALICDLCGKVLSHASGTNAPLVEEFVEARHWQVLDGGEVVCNRCTPFLHLLVAEIREALNTSVAV